MFDRDGRFNTINPFNPKKKKKKKKKTLHPHAPPISIPTHQDDKNIDKDML
jgi:hypothetical protein